MVYTCDTPIQETSSPLEVNNCQVENAEYVGTHLDRRLTWRNNILLSANSLAIYYNSVGSLAGYLNFPWKTKSCSVNPLLSQLQGTSNKFNLAILQIFQIRCLRNVIDERFYVSSEIMQRDIPLTSIKNLIHEFCVKYSVRIVRHSNALASQWCVGWQWSTKGKMSSANKNDLRRLIIRTTRSKCIIYPS